MLVENNYIERKPTLKETYYSILDPHKIDYDKPAIWDLVGNNEVMDLFQFDSLVAMQTVNQIKPRSLIELAQTNSLMRLQPQDGAKETPVETYVRYKNNIQEWYDDMDSAKVPKSDQEFIKEILLPFNGVADTQEAIMALSRVVGLTNFSIGEAHRLRSVIGKKLVDQIPVMKEFFYSKGKENGVCENTLTYLWYEQFMLQLSYAFSIIHCISYTFIASNYCK